MTDKRLKLALHIATPAMRRPILEFATRGFRVVSLQVYYDAEPDQKVLVQFADPDDLEGEAFVVHQDGTVSVS